METGVAPVSRVPVANRYVRFLVVGSAVAALTIAVREGLALLLGDKTPLAYSVSVLLAYGIGILVNFRLQRAVTFTGWNDSRWLRAFIRFVLVAFAGAAVTWACAFALQYGIPLEELLGPASGAVAFAVGCFVASFVTFGLNVTYVFRTS
jgi:putative flippase GtrA